MKKVLSILFLIAVLTAVLLLPFSAFGATIKGIESASYVLKNDTDGYAEGTVTLKVMENSIASDVYLYWGDANGKLEGYSYLAKFKATVGVEQTFEVPSYTVIPAEATKLYIYAGLSARRSDPFIIDLPENSAMKSFGDLKVEFQICSDIHLTGSQSADYDFNTVLLVKDIAKTSPDSMGLFINGDIAHRGKIKQYEELYSIIEKYNSTLPVYCSIGNHDFINPDTSSYYFDSATDFTKETSLYNTVARPRFLQYCTNDESVDLSREKVYYDYWIGDYHFIMLGGERCCSNAVLTDTQLDWLRGVLENGKDRACATFVLLHNSFYNTIAGSLPGQTWNGVIAGDDAWAQWVNDQGTDKMDWREVRTQYETALIDILNDYDDIELFNGHSHWVFESECNAYKADGTYPNIFNTASVAYLWSSYDIVTGEEASGSQAYFVYVYEDCIVLRGRNIDDESTWNGCAYYCIPLSGNGTAPENKIRPSWAKEEETSELDTTSSEPESTTPSETNDDTTIVVEEKKSSCASTMTLSLVPLALVPLVFRKKRK